MKIKKISALVLSLMLVFAMSISAFAASKDDIISKLQSAGVATEYVNVAKQFLADNTVSDADAAYVISKMQLLSLVLQFHLMHQITQLQLLRMASHMLLLFLLK